ncbi:MAG: NAD-dependent malic enzyme [Oscillospiraceae bacterium]|nr:NAD-dependent malic enzyme [Oscillospiraceae bacterium]
MSTINERSLLLHEENRGKLRVESAVAITNADELSLAYTPGVAEPCRKIAADPNEVYRYTVKSHTVAVISDGSAVLGLGNIGAAAAIPVMEGKCALFKEFGGVDAFPICLDTQDEDEIVETCIRLAPVFGGINLEDISAPRCFAVERRLREALDIPVFHDDQHGTAIVVTAALLNACRLTGKSFSSLRAVVNGAGAAGSAISRMLLGMGIGELFVCDTKGIICRGRTAGMNADKEELAQLSNRENRTGSLADALRGSDVFIGVSKPGVLTGEMIRTMNADPMIFAMANPEPEILPDAALAAGAAIVGTGRSDFPNQINNVLAFPGLFKGALSVRSSAITENMKHAAARAIAALVSDEELKADYLLPAAFDPRVAPAVAEAAAAQARADGVARI